MIHRHYNPWHITNSGERAADRQFSMPVGADDFPVHILYQQRISSRFLEVRMAGECDFMVFTQQGIMVIEVKGGLIGFGRSEQGDHGFYRFVKSNMKEHIRNPFLQNDSNKDGVRRFLNEKGIVDIFVGTLVCFPECSFEGDNLGFEALWQPGTGKGLVETIVKALQDQSAEFDRKQELKNRALQVKWRTLTGQDLADTIKLFNPEFDPQLHRSRAMLNKGEAARRADAGFHILSGLDENRRIMVQGPPGSGKTTYAIRIIAKLCIGENKRGLYLCWNDLLADSMRNRIKQPGSGIPEGSIDIYPFYYFIAEMATMLGDPGLLPTFEMVKEGKFKHLVWQCLSRLHKQKSFPKYDFIIADEAQDLFSKGLDQVIKSLLMVNNPLQKGNYYIFYDDCQAYPWAADLEAYIRTRDAVREHSAHFVLSAGLRSSAGEGITELIQDAGQGKADPLKPYGKDVVFVEWKTPAELMALLRRCIEQEKTLTRFKPVEMAVLFTAGLLKEGGGINELLCEATDLELLAPRSETVREDCVNYTKILKSKGLEWEVVYLVCSNISDAKVQYQLFIGGSRARSKVYVFLKNSKN